ncbi:MAG: hypothetical protein JWN06_1889, partial [Propionibacteriaceae bacterium]|nr:hypothetical protein [Propionibacteriaceae bacterium]
LLISHLLLSNSVTGTGPVPRGDRAGVGPLTYDDEPS